MSSRKQWTTPQKIFMVESIKKSIHRSVEKINPAQYKNLLKGQSIYMHLSYQGQTINTQYTKVALFMGATVYKKAYEKITVVVTNQIANKTVKKLIGMGKPIVSVLWLQACFQQKRKVPYSDFLFEQEKNENFHEQDESEQFRESFEIFLQSFQEESQDLHKKVQKKINELNIVKFMDKKEKNNQKFRQYTIFPQQIDFGGKRRSDIVSERVNLKKNKKKIEFKSEGPDKKEENRQMRESQQFFTNSEAENEQINSERDYAVENRQSTNLIYKKYLKDFREYESKCKNEKDSIAENFLQNDTPFFSITETKQQNNMIFSGEGEAENLDSLNTPNKNTSTKQFFTKTCSVKKKALHSQRSFSCINNGSISTKIEEINQRRVQDGQDLICFDTNITKNTIVLVAPFSKVDVLRALIENPQKIISERFLDFLQKNCTELTDDIIGRFEIKAHINENQITNKKVVLLDSVIGVQFLQRVIKKYGGRIVKLGDFLFDNKVDYVISNRQTYIRTDKQSYQVFTQGKFIDSLIEFRE